MAYGFEHLIADVPDFPKPGIVFKDITPVLSDAAGFRCVVDALAADWRGKGLTQVVGVESRGFIFGAGLAYALGVGLALVRKKGKLPRETRSVRYDLEYGTDELEIHADAFKLGDRALIIDDVLATGGTAAGTAELVRGAGAELVGMAFVLELDFLRGRDKLPGGLDVRSLLHVG
jgi:adenine phosphoribosyltransferase